MIIARDAAAEKLNGTRKAAAGNARNAAANFPEMERYWLMLEFKCQHCGSQRVYYRTSEKTMQCLECNEIWQTGGRTPPDNTNEGGQT